MHINRIPMLLLLALVLHYSSLRAQISIIHSAAATPTANNFAYPQSIFVDSPNGHIWVTDFDNHRVLRFDVSALTMREKNHSLLLPGESFLSQNYPNPFNPVTTISFSVTKSGHAMVTIYNLLGQEVATIFNENVTAHTVYSFPFDAKDLPSGIYLYTLRSANCNLVKRMCLLK